MNKALRMEARLHSAAGQDGFISGTIDEYHFEANVQYLPSALDNEPWRVTRFHLWIEDADNSATCAQCCKYEDGEWIKGPASYREETATRAALRRLRGLPAPTKL